ncbi:hypothetical protein [Kushneria indalinina]|uniref:Uncharacterized protein n=1 Tax=Kushneria indalinina DSM 14324 TaxID=1122140 RepID=A0A3D9DRP3_9GAMM|nr:hypothetical protein [Kushneria indalinina]REC93305.1 hypothetical protein C8D72_3461 [Kushneria indalinina DSM 14324]
MNIGRIVAPTGAGKSLAIEKYISNQEKPDVHVVDLEKEQDIDVHGLDGSIIILDHSHRHGGKLALEWLKRIESLVQNGVDIKAVILVGQTTVDSYWQDVLAENTLIYSHSLSEKSNMDFTPAEVKRFMEGALNDCLHALRVGLVRASASTSVQ